MRNERGIALLVVLVVVTLLTITVTEFTYSVQLDQHRARNAINALQASLLARSGINVAESFLTQDAPYAEQSYDAFTEEWWLALEEFCTGLALSPTMRVKCAIEDESGKINLNATRARPLPPQAEDRPTRDAYLRDAMRRIFEAHGIDVEIVDRLKDYWLQEPPPDAQGRRVIVPEFRSLEDFAATFRISTPELLQLRPLLTARPLHYARAININTAPAEVLAAVLNDPEVVATVLARQREEEPFRHQGDIREALQDLQDANILATLFDVKSFLFRLQASALTNADPTGARSGGIGQTLSVLVLRLQSRRRLPGQDSVGWTLRPLDWQKEGGARLFRRFQDDLEPNDTSNRSNAFDAALPPG